jgi:hypothetical protein
MGFPFFVCATVIVGPIFPQYTNIIFEYVYEYPTRCNDNILVLLQDLYMFRVPAVPIIRSTKLQWAVNGIFRC